MAIHVDAQGMKVEHRKRRKFGLKEDQLIVSLFVQDKNPGEIADVLKEVYAIRRLPETIRGRLVFLGLLPPPKMPVKEKPKIREPETKPQALPAPAIGSTITVIETELRGRVVCHPKLGWMLDGVLASLDDVMRAVNRIRKARGDPQINRKPEWLQ